MGEQEVRQALKPSLVGFRDVSWNNIVKHYANNIEPSDKGRNSFCEAWRHLKFIIISLSKDERTKTIKFAMPDIDRIVTRIGEQQQISTEEINLFNAKLNEMIEAADKLQLVTTKSL